MKQNMKHIKYLYIWCIRYTIVYTKFFYYLKYFMLFVKEREREREGQAVNIYRDM